MMTDAARYDRRVVVVTGSSRGLGRLLVEHFVDEGANVVGVSRGESDLIHERYEHVPCDIGDDRSVRDLFIAIAREHGRIDILVNNAAVLTSVHAMLMPAERAEEMVRTNLLGNLFASREAAKIMRRHGHGRIINIGSMASTLEPIGDSVYAATKAAGMTLTGVLAKEFAPYGITVNMVAVSALDTEMYRQLTKGRVDAVVANLPLPRLATPDDVFNVIDFFSSDRSAYVTAQTVFLGGVHA